MRVDTQLHASSPNMLPGDCRQPGFADVFVHDISWPLWSKKAGGAIVVVTNRERSNLIRVEDIGATLTMYVASRTGSQEVVEDTRHAESMIDWLDIYGGHSDGAQGSNAI